MNDTLFNGARVTPDLARHRGLHYGDGVFRTCLIYDSHVYELKEQIDKALADAARLGLSVSDPAELAAECEAMAAGQSRAVLKILLMRAGDGRGYRSPSPVRHADRLLCRYPAPAYPAAAWERGVRTFRSSFRLAAQPALAGIKHLNRLEQVLAAREWEEGAAEGLLSDDQGRPLSGTRSNLFWVRHGTLYTPPLDRCGVAGLMRDKVLQAAASLGYPRQVAADTWDDVENSDEVFLTNSLIGLWPVAGCGPRAWTAPGPVTRRLMELIRHPRLLET